MRYERWILIFVLLAVLRGACWSQSEDGVLAGVLADSKGRALAGVEVRVQGTPPSFVRSIRTGADGRFRFRLPYGSYRLTSGSASLQSERTVYVPPAGQVNTGLWETQQRHLPAKPKLPEFTGIESLLLALEPTAVTEPLNLTGTATVARPLLSLRGFSWTSTRYEFHGLNATDPYQPGRPGIVMDPAAIEEVIASDSPLDSGPAAYGPGLSVLLRSLPEQWHSSVSTSFTNAGLASGNLPDVATRGLVRQSELFRWFTRDHVETGGPLGRRVALFLSGTGQWASQTVPLEEPGADLKSRFLLMAARVRVQATAKDRVDGYFNGALIGRSDWGEPAGIEALIARRGGPTWSLAQNGFPGTPERDRLYNAVAAWSRPVRDGMLQFRAGVTGMRLETRTGGGVSRADLLDGITNRTAPLSGTGERTVFEVAARYDDAPRMLAGWEHEIAGGAEWEEARVRNRLDAPSEWSIITSAGAPASALALNTPLDYRARTRHVRGWVRDEIVVTSWLKANAGVALDAARGNPISWTNVSPRAALAFTPGSFRGLIFRAGYARVYVPLAARYLDYVNPASLSGVEFRWADSNGDGLLQTGELGQAVRRFGGAFSSIDPGLKRPYADQIDAGAEAQLPWGISAGLRGFRRDEKNRLAAINTGVPASAYRPVQMLDPGPDGLTGTFDDARFTAYAQDPGTLGADRYLLTNAQGLKTLDAGVIAELGARLGTWHFHTSFAALKSYGPTNPGNLPLQNDPGVVGALASDQNSWLNATGRAFFDRAYIGKVQLQGVLPKALGRIEWGNIVTYMDGLPFARILLITELPQWPFWVNGSVHGSPGGGNRAEYVLNWNLRLARTFRVSGNAARVGADVFNAVNMGNRIQEIDTSGTGFNARLPVAIQPARSARLFLEWRF